MNNNFQFFSDFDGTITKEDTLNKFLRLYADETWLDIENDWTDGKIGSKECLEQQMALVRPISDTMMQEFLSSIQIDEYFKKFYETIQEKGIDFYIVSDGFDFFIKNILLNYGITPKYIFANHLEFKNGKFYMSFPYFNKDCKKCSGMCKCTILERYRNVTKSVIYAGDGLSDYCVSSSVDILFAKGTLYKHCIENNRSDSLKFDNFASIIDFLDEKRGNLYARNEV